ncbi:ty3-gypsy retrotransposon protein [Tanacetum coccineum]
MDVAEWDNYYLGQLSMVEEYQWEFEKLMNRVTHIPETLLISFYICGLKLHIQRELLVSRPVSLRDAFALAQITEARLEDQTAPATEEDDMGVATGDGGEDAFKSGDILILNLLIGYRSPRSLQLWGKISKGDVHVLIDNGSTHNFICPDVVEKMCLPIKSTKAFKLYIGSRESLLCKSVCLSVTLHMKGMVMEVDLYVLPMQGLDVVLGIQWLQNLGKVTHDYAHQTMEFTLLDTTYSLKGDGLLRMKKISLHQMQAMLEHNDVYGVYKVHHLSIETEVEEMRPETAGPHLAELDNFFSYLIHYSRYLLLYLFIALNAVTVKDKFPIPMADEMFDELGGEHQFYVKKTTCVFGAETLEYLGHKISGHGVEMDPKKELKQQLSTAPILSLPDFMQEFVVEADTSDYGIGAILIQHNRLFSYFSQKLGPRMRTAATYQKELFAIVEVYKPGVANQVADALSRIYEDGELELRALHQQLDTGSRPDGFRQKQGWFIFRNRYYVGMESKLKALLLREFHETPSSGHEGVKKMLVELSALFYWRRMRKSVEDYIQQCMVCQQTKYSTQAVGGYLKPLPTPEGVWEDVSMDFITGLPLSKGFTAILVVVDRFSKYAYFGVLPTNFNGHKVAKLFMEIVVKHHGIPKTIVSDRDLIFVSKFWKELFRLSGTQLNHSIAYHPQSDGQTEVVNQGLEQYLRAIVSDRPQQWVRLLPWTEYCYNTSYYSSIKMSPYQALYGRLPLSLIPYPPGASKITAVDELLMERNEVT